MEGEVGQKLNDLSSNLFDSLIQETAKADVIRLDDSSNLPLQGVSMYGKTMKWNQFVDNSQFVSITTNGVTYTVNADGSITANGTADGNSVFPFPQTDMIAGHKYVLSGCPFGGNQTTYKILTSSDLPNDIGLGSVGTQNKSGIFTHRIIIYSGVTVNNITFRPCVSDLTEMDIADKVSTYADFLKYVPKGIDQYAYDAGSLVSTDAPTLTLKGQKPLEKYVGVASEKYGIVNTANNRYCVYADVEQGKQYTITTDFEIGNIRLYNTINNNSIAINAQWIGGNFVFVVNGEYDKVGFNLRKDSTNPTLNIDDFEEANLSFFKKGEEPQSVQPLDADGNPIVLRGLEVTSGGNYTDENGKQWLCDTLEVKADGSGVITRILVYAKFKDLSWTKENEIGRYRSMNNAYTYAMKYLTIKGINSIGLTHFTGVKDGTIAVTNSQAIPILRLQSEKYSGMSEAEFVSEMTRTNAEMVIERYEPTTETISAESVRQLLAMRTYKPITNAFLDKVGGVGVTYIADTKAYINKLIAETQALALEN